MTIFMPIRADYSLSTSFVTTPLVPTFFKQNIKNIKNLNKNARYDSTYPIYNFLESLKHNPKEAVLYISKNYIDKIDINLVPKGVNTPILSGASFVSAPKNCKTHTVLTFSDYGAAFLHFYILKEINYVSYWKIYSLEKESL